MYNYKKIKKMIFFYNNSLMNIYNKINKQNQLIYKKIYYYIN